MKLADFGKEYVTDHKAAQSTLLRKAGEDNLTVHACYLEKKTFAEIVKGRCVSTNTIRTIKSYEIGNRWLYESALARFNPSSSVDEFHEEIVRRGFGNVKVRVESGRDMVLSFHAVEIMKENGLRICVNQF